MDGFLERSENKKDSLFISYSGGSIRGNFLLKLL